MGSPESLPSPRGAHLEMVGAVVAGEGLARVAEIAAAHTHAPVAVIVPRLGAPVEDWAPYERYVAARLAGGKPKRPAEVSAEVPIVSGGQELGAVLMLAKGGADAGEYLHVAAVAALTEVAVAEARDETEQNLRGSFLEELRTRDDLEPGDVIRRSARLGCDLSGGAVALVADPGPRAPGRLLAAIASECAPALAQRVGDRVYALLPVPLEEARRVAARLGRQATVGLSSCYSEPSDMRRALEEAELVLEVTHQGGGPPSQEIGDGTYRLLFRVLASHPEEVRSFYEDTLAKLVAYDEQYTTDLVGTLEAYLGNNCNMNATAGAIHAHRHTVSYRLERIRELTGLDPFTSEDRERLGLGLKAYRIIAPQLPR
ncbi:MAG: helix-turn-helix domain-containing protein [Thermoleophilaceae bacterium]|nr:helix-turn-helix domain-containing protein [Thermoleophilaceae bacterium]